MDARVDQADGYRFVYCLPFDEDRHAGRGHLLYRHARARRRRRRRADRRLCRRARLEGRHAASARRRACCRWRWAAISTPSGRSAAPGSPGSACAAASSTRPPAIRCPTRCAPLLLLAGAGRSSTARSARSVRATRPRRLWRKRGLLPHCSTACCSAPPTPAERYQVLEHFYRLDPALIARFYAGTIGRARQDADPERQAAGAGRPGRRGAAGPAPLRTAAVIGAGFGGLALAIRLQSAGIATTIVEARDKPGGRAYIWEKRRLHVRRRPDRHHRSRLPQGAVGADRRRHGRRCRAGAGHALLPAELAGRHQLRLFATTTPR